MTSLSYNRPPRRRVHRRAARLAAGDLPPGPRSRPRRRPGGRGDDQAERAALLRAAGQHLRAAGHQGSRQRVPLRRRDRPRSRRASSPAATTTRRPGPSPSTKASDQRPGAADDVRADHRQQPRRRMAQAQARGLTAARRAKQSHRRSAGGPSRALAPRSRSCVFSREATRRYPALPVVRSDPPYPLEVGSSSGHARFRPADPKRRVPCVTCQDRVEWRCSCGDEAALCVF